MTAEHVDPETVIEAADGLAPGDEVRLARQGYEYSSPLVVLDVTVEEWLGAGDEVNYESVRVELTTGYEGSNPHIVTATSGGRTRWQQGDKNGRLDRFEPVESTADRDVEGEDADPDVPFLPEDVSVQEVHEIAAREEYLRDVAAELSLSEGEARAMLWRLDLYTDIKEGGRR